jgi:hypothetical protein
VFKNQFLNDECIRCTYYNNSGNDPFIQKHFSDISINNENVNETCPVCNRKEEDEFYLGQLYANLLK